jgi:hypothetical protein
MAENPLLLRLVRLLAAQDVDDYLSREAAPQAAPEPERPNPVPLPDMDKAA